MIILYMHVSYSMEYLSREVLEYSMYNILNIIFFKIINMDSTRARNIA